MKSIFNKNSDDFNLIMVIKREKELIKKIKDSLKDFRIREQVKGKWENSVR